jgi:hypothetical protein
LKLTKTRKRVLFLDKPLPDKPLTNVQPMKGSHGGARPGAGWPKGKKWPSTLRKEEARELVRQFITERLPEFLDAMAATVVGTKHLMMRDPKSGQFTRVTGDARQVDKAVKSKNACWIYTKDPNVQAFTDLLNRAIDRPAEHVQLEGADGGPLVIKWQTREDEPKLLEGKVIEIKPEPEEKNGNG